MSRQPQTGMPTLRFGVFEADLSTRELFRNGTRVRLQEQPFQILAALLERPGETVGREELRQRLWPGNTFVEYDDSLNTAVRKLRSALSDRSDEPRYIETVARRGYRFVAPIAAPPPDSSNQTAPATVQSRSLRRTAWQVLALAIRLVAVAVGLLLARPVPQPRLVRILALTHSGALHPNQKLLTDGLRLYFTEKNAGHWVQKWMPVSGGGEVSISLPFHADLQDISPDGSELPIRDIREEPGETLWTVSTTGGIPHQLGLGEVVAAAYSRDGQSLLYARDSVVFTCDRAGGKRRQFLTLPGTVFGINISPPGDRLRFYVAERDAGVALWESQSDGSNPHRVIRNSSLPRREWGGNWSPDGRWFTFSAPRGTLNRDVWLLGQPSPLRPHLSPVALTSGPMDFVYPIFSRNGKQIFVVGVTRRGELLRYDFRHHEFSNFLGGISAEYVAFSPDKKSLVYVTYPEGQLWRARADGTEAVQLTTAPMKVVRPSWSPDGARIAFEGKPTREDCWNVYMIPSTGGIAEVLAKNTDLGGFTWRPDSRSLIIGGNSDQTSPLRLIDFEHGSTADLAGFGHATDPSLSPSGRYLIARTPGENEMMFDLVSHHHTHLAAAAGDLGYPDWSADERYVYFNRFMGTVPALYRVRLSDGSVERLMELTQFSAGGSWGTWSTIMPDGSLLLMRDIGGADLYALDWSESER